MSTFAVVDLSGKLLRIVTAPTPEMENANVGAGEIRVDELPSVNSYWSGATWTTIPAQPSPYHQWNWSAKLWEDLRTLEEIKNQQWEIIKQARDVAITAPLSTSYGSFDADARSQKNITDAVQLLQVLEAQQPNQTIDFTLSDNTTITLTTQQMVNVGLALGQRTQQIYNISRQLRAQLDLAQTKQEVEAITWPT